jgi:hypothetical protein
MAEKLKTLTRSVSILAISAVLGSCADEFAYFEGDPLIKKCLDNIDSLKPETTALVRGEIVTGYVGTIPDGSTCRVAFYPRSKRPAIVSIMQPKK